jgi:hypothetical protein
LKVNLTQGADCIDLAAQEAHCALTFQITGGTGRFKDASGVLSFTETVVPVLADALHNPAFFRRYGGVYRNGLRSNRGGEPPGGPAIGRHILLIVALLGTITDVVRRWPGTKGQRKSNPEVKGTTGTGPDVQSAYYSVYALAIVTVPSVPLTS